MNTGGRRDKAKQNTRINFYVHGTTKHKIDGWNARVNALIELRGFQGCLVIRLAIQGNGILINFV